TNKLESFDKTIEFSKEITKDPKYRDIALQEIDKIVANLSPEQKQFLISKGINDPDKKLEIANQFLFPEHISDPDIKELYESIKTNAELNKKQAFFKSMLKNVDLNSIKNLSTLKTSKQLLESDSKQTNIENSTRSEIINEITKKSNEYIEAFKKLYIGTKISKEDWSEMMNSLEFNEYDREVRKKYDGYTTQGPFCLEKQNYFKNIFRPSIKGHWDTEFREPVPTKTNKQELSNDIQDVKFKKGVLEVPINTNLEIANEEGVFDATNSNI